MCVTVQICQIFWKSVPVMENSAERIRKNFGIYVLLLWIVIIVPDSHFCCCCCWFSCPRKAVHELFVKAKNAIIKYVEGIHYLTACLSKLIHFYFSICFLQTILSVCFDPVLVMNKWSGGINSNMAVEKICDGRKKDISKLVLTRFSYWSGNFETEYVANFTSSGVFQLRQNRTLHWTYFLTFKSEFKIKLY